MYCSDAFQRTRFSRRILTLSGQVTDAMGAPLADVTINYHVNGESAMTTTNADGLYFIRVREGDHVRITPSLGLGVIAEPERYVLCCACSDCFNLDFMVNPLVPATVRISGALVGTSPLIANATINYTVNGAPASTMSAMDGTYFFDAAPGSNITITAPTIPGFAAVPPNIDLMNVVQDQFSQNFTYMPV